MHIPRRNFIARSLGASGMLALGTSVPWFVNRTALAAAGRPAERRPVLVVLQLSGGNDGLNTVVPYEDDSYHRNRPTLRLKPESVLKVGSGLGLHPEMMSFLRLYQEGHLGIVQGVGCAEAGRDHEGAMRGWGTAFLDGAQTGWVGRVVDRFQDDSASARMDGAFVGNIRPPFGIHAQRAVVPALRAVEPLLGANEVTAHTELQNLVGIPRPADNPLCEFVRQSTLAALAGSQRLQAVLAQSAGGSEYPAFPLAQTLRSIAQLIRADLGLRVFFAELGGGGIGGFDTHAGQAINHGALLSELADSVAAFVDDLRRDRWFDSVLLMTFSEFGRTLAENGRHGTDHGAAAPVFLAGGKLKGGLVGAHPSLTLLDDNAPKPHTDPRRLYAMLLENWLGLESGPILGGKWEPLAGVLA